MIWAFNGWRFKSKLSIADVGKRTFRVWPTDIDAFNHMNNGVYLTLMDLGRFDLMLRAGKWQELKKLGWYPVVVSVSIVFRKSLAPWVLFDIETKIIGWDSEAVYAEQGNRQASLAKASARNCYPYRTAGTTWRLAR